MGWYALKTHYIQMFCFLFTHIHTLTHTYFPTREGEREGERKRERGGNCVLRGRNEEKKKSRRV